MARTIPPTGPFIDPAAPTLETVVETLGAGRPAPRRAAEMASAVRTLCRVLGKTPRELPADAALLGRLIRRALPAAAGVNPGRWNNVKSLVPAALAASGL